MTRALNRLAAATALSALAFALSTPASAQVAEPVTEPEAPTEEEPGSNVEVATAAPEEIVVTGSRIRGIAPVGSNVIAIDQEAIAESPVVSTNDLLRRVPQVVSLGANRAGGSAQNGAANATRGAGINLRGISTNATLLLYDGRRFPPQGTQGQFTDPSVIPSIALGRVEVIADGASAIYGSDAIAGVVNFVLRKNFDGLEARGRYGFTDGNFKEAQAALIGGKRWNGGYVMAAGEWSRNTNLMGRDLDFYQDNNLDRGGRDLRGFNCNPGTITAAGSPYAIPAGGVTPATASALVRNTRNPCFYNGADAVIPEQERWSFVGAASQELADGVRLFVDGFWSRREGDIPALPSVNATVPSSNPFYVAPVGVTPGFCAGSVGAPAGARCVTVTYSLFPEIGVLVNPYHAKSWNVVGGVEAALFNDFKATAYYAYGKAEEVADRRLGINAGALQTALNDPNPATSFNVFGGPNNPATIAKVTDNLFVITGKSRLEVFNGQVDGPLFAIPGGEVRIAVGGEHRIEYSFTDLITGQAANQLSVNDDGSRNVDALFGEVFIPIVGAANASPGLDRLSLSAAVRYEKYSDFGSTTNPKFGINYAPFPGLTLKGSYGTSFRAPTFTEVSTIAGGAGLYFDTLTGPNGSQTGIGIAGGNPELKPETAKTWSFGIEAAPPEVPGLRTSLTYFRIDYEDQIQALRGTQNLLTSPLYAAFRQFNPTPAEVAALVNSGLPINQPITQSLVTFIVDGRRQNLGRTLLRGLDFTSSYEWQWGNAKLDAGVNATYMLDYLFESVPGSGLRDVLNTLGFSQRFRAQADVGAEIGAFRSRVIVNHLGGYDNTGISPKQPVKAYNTVDLVLAYDVTDNITLGADVRNLFNQDPPFVDTARGYDPQSANPIPRLISFNARVKI